MKKTKPRNKRTTSKNRKTSSKSRLITPLGLSIVLNIILFLAVMSGVITAVYANEHMTKGTPEAYRTVASMHQAQCRRMDTKFDNWLAGLNEKEELSAKRASYAKLLLLADCRHESYQPYEEAALKEYFKANGLEYPYTSEDPRAEESQ
jgi:hypothetical protein